MARNVRAGGLVPYAYRPGNSVLHRLPGAVKLLGLLALSSAAFFFGICALAAASGLVIAGALLARIRPWELLRGSRPLIVMLLLVLLCRSVKFDPFGFNRTGCIEALLFIWVILLSFSAGALLFSVTTMTELKNSLGTLEKALLYFPIRLLRSRRTPRTQKLLLRLERPRLCLGISLMLGFLPRFFEIWESAETAYRARGGRKGLHRIVTLIPLVIERMIERAAETAQALESRGLIL
jgi:biotin transport system permease protein